MKRRLLVFILGIIIIFAIFLYTLTKKSKNICITKLNETILYTEFCPNEVKNIPLGIAKSSSKLKSKYNITLLIFNPEGKGNYTVALLNLRLSIPSLIPVCSYYYKSCKYYLGNISQDKIILFEQAHNRIIRYTLNRTKTLLIYLREDNITRIYEQNGNIYIEGTQNTIRKAIDRFIFWWYGIENN